MDNGNTRGVQSNINNKSRKPMKAAVATQQTPNAASTGICPKCGFRRRHQRNCPLKKKGEDEDEVVWCVFLCFLF